MGVIPPEGRRHEPSHEQELSFGPPFALGTLALASAPRGRHGVRREHEHGRRVSTASRVVSDAAGWVGGLARKGRCFARTERRPAPRKQRRCPGLPILQVSGHGAARVPLCASATLPARRAARRRGPCAAGAVPYTVLTARRRCVLAGSS